MDENIHKDQLEDFFREAIDGYTEEPPDDWWEELEEQIPPKPPMVVRSLWQQYNWAVAAMLLVAMGGALFFWNNGKQQALNAQLDQQKQVIEALTQQVDSLAERVVVAETKTETNKPEGVKAEFVAQTVDKKAIAEAEEKVAVNTKESTKPVNKVPKIAQMLPREKAVKEMNNLVVIEKGLKKNTERSLTDNIKEQQEIASVNVKEKDLEQVDLASRNEANARNINETVEGQTWSTASANQVIVETKQPLLLGNEKEEQTTKVTETEKAYFAQMNSFRAGQDNDGVNDQNWGAANANQKADQKAEQTTKVIAETVVEQEVIAPINTIPNTYATNNWIDRVLDTKAKEGGQLVGTNLIKKGQLTKRPLVALAPKEMTNLNTLPAHSIPVEQAINFVAEPLKELPQKTVESLVTNTSKNSSLVKKQKRQRNKGKLAIKEPKDKDTKWYLTALAGPQYAFRHFNQMFAKPVEGIVSGDRILHLNEKAGFAYTAGLKAGVQKGKHWAIEAGLQYNKRALIVDQGFEMNAFEAGRGRFNPRDKVFNSNLHVVYNSSYGNLSHVIEVEGDNKLVNNEPKNFDIVSDITSKIKLTSLQVPIQGVYRMGQNRWRVAVKGGLIGEFFISRVTATSTELKCVKIEEDKPNFTYIGGTVVGFHNNRYNSININASVAAALEYQLTKNIALVLEPFYNHSLSPYTQQEDLGGNVRNSTTDFALGANVGVKVSL